MLSVDDNIRSFVDSLEDEVAHVVFFTGIGDNLVDILPEITPLFVGPGVVSLKAGHLVFEAISENLSEALVGGIKIDRAHDW